MKNGIIILTAIGMLTLSSCASIVSKSRYTIPFASTPTGAQLVIRDLVKDVIVHEGFTPTSVELKSGAGFFRSAKYEVTFNMDGYDPVTVQLKAHFDGWYVGNIVFGGLIGLLIVDPATGAMYKLDTDPVQASMSQSTSDSRDFKLQVYRIDDVPERSREHLQPIN